MLAGPPVLVREEAKIDYDGAFASLALMCKQTIFSARWTRTMDWNIRATIASIQLGDGVRVWVDDILIVDEWFDQQDAWTFADLYLTAGKHQFK